MGEYEKLRKLFSELWIYTFIEYAYLIVVTTITTGGCGEKICHVEKIFPCDRLSCGEVSPHDKCSVGDRSPHGK